MPDQFVDTSFNILFQFASISPLYPPVTPLPPIPLVSANTMIRQGRPIADALTTTTTQPIAFCCGPAWLPIYTEQVAAQLGAPAPTQLCPFIMKPGAFVSDPTKTVKGKPILTVNSVFICKFGGGVPCTKFLGASNISTK